MAATTPPNHRAASRLAQLLGETIVHHTPWSAKVQNEEKWRQTNDWLERLEDHSNGLLEPLIGRILEESNPPEEIAAFLRAAVKPTQEIQSILMEMFVYGIVTNMIGAAIQPFVQGITNDLNKAAVASGIHVPLDASSIATAAARGLELGAPPTVKMPDWAAKVAAESGVGEDDINLLASIVGLPPALQELFELYRRGKINIDEVKQGLREGDFRDDWVDRVTELVHAWLTPSDFIRAAIQEQMPYSDAREWAGKVGLDVETELPLDTGTTAATPDMFGLAYAIGGRPPGPEQLGNMALRGIIGWDGSGVDATTFQQGIAESDVKTKWTPALRKLMQYVPAPASVGTLLERGAITKEQAVAYWAARGVPKELAEGYAYIAEQEHVGQDKLLARGDITTALYDGIIDTTEATNMLGLLGYQGKVAEDIIAVTMFRREIRAINQVVGRVGSLYESYRLSEANARSALHTIGIPDAQADALLETWAALRVQPIRLPSAREIGRAVRVGTITNDQGLAELAKLGYEPRDAAIVLSSYSEEPVTPLPGPGASVTGVGEL